jgi:hypothetical protein
MNPLDTQVAGSHYKDHAIQPIQYIVANELPFCEGNVIKYVTRHRTKGGAEDLRKARHYIDLILKLRYGEDP